ncbi:glycosyltransferase family 2 protein [Nesterenkonia populi]|uniref:glycosyltransferase family 2 protein n=1 Tax=Nesterenkonia populi TaxID=1591087 RepID=UPI00147939CA|nr:glycosyltransferase [Nesterenkonia populi]
MTAHTSELLPAARRSPQRSGLTMMLAALAHSLRSTVQRPPGTDLIRPVAHVSCVIPAYNEEDSIRSVLEALLTQTRPPQTIHVIANNVSDDTVWEAEKLAGFYRSRHKNTLYETQVVVHDIGNNADKKVGALNYGWDIAKAEGAKYILGVDGDTTLHKKCLEYLLEEMEGDTRIGGLSAIYSFDPPTSRSPVRQFLVAAQKAQFADFNMDNLLRNRNMAVLGGQASLFRAEALQTAATRYHQSHPWTTDSEVEDSLLSLQIRDAGYLTKISSRARASVGAMETLRSLYAQQVKWTTGGIELMKHRPFHPNLRLRWKETTSMVFNILCRLLFVVLLVTSLSIGAFMFHPVWLIPPVAAWLLAVRVTWSMKNRTVWDWLYSALLLPAEMYMWLRATYFISSWWQVLTKVERDNWGAQASAESGRGGSGMLWPLVVITVIGGVIAYSWQQLTAEQQAGVISMGWPILMVITIALTIGMLTKVLRRHRGFRV